MSDDGDHTCPLCAEEMDLTDQQLKPCKCGYEICVWCWHHIMDMAEKDNTEGRCPACRGAYDKERIIKMAANCGRMVAEINAEKKQKSQKAKPKSSLEARKHLTNVRVIRRNLAYIVGLPMTICDENILERKEYFGQYGRVLKVSISRPTGTATQKGSANNTFSVYITYGKEEEAIRCIQAVHNFVLEGKMLRACFGTTKYCHAWLRNTNCNNPDCLFLHEVGKQEDSYTKDEIISEYTRSRVPQTGSNNLQRLSGSKLPPPVDDFSSSGAVSSMQVQKNGFHSTASQTKTSPPFSSGGRNTLPAATSWGLRNVSSSTVTSSAAMPQTLSKSKVEINHPNLSSADTTQRPVSAWNDMVSTNSKARREVNIISQSAKPYKPGILKNSQMKTSEVSLDIGMNSISSAWNDDEVVPSVVASKECDEGCSARFTKECIVDSEDVKSSSEAVKYLPRYPLSSGDDTSCTSKNISSSLYLSSTRIAELKDLDTCVIGTADDIECSGLGHLTKQLGVLTLDSMSNSENANLNIENLSTGLSSVCLDRSELHSLTRDSDQDAVSCNLAGRAAEQNEATESSFNNVEYLSRHSISRNKYMWEQSNFSGCSEALEIRSITSVDKTENTLLSTSNQYDGSRITSQLPSSIYQNASDFPKYNIWEGACDKFIYPANPEHVVSSANECAGLPNGLLVGDSRTVCRPGKVSEHPGANFEHEFCTVRNKGSQAANVHNEESSIISDILSLNFDPWDDTSSSTDSLVKMLGDINLHDAHFRSHASWKPKSSSESRFSFARQDAEGNHVDSSQRDYSQEKNFSLLSQNYYDDFQNGFASRYSEGLNGHVNCSTDSIHDPPIGAPSISGASVSKISAPLGFAAPSIIPPPGFSSQSKFNQLFDPLDTENHMPDNLMSSNQYQANQTFLNQNSIDIEYLDPAILAIGKGPLPRANDSGLDMKLPSNFKSQFNTPSSDARNYLLMEQSMSSQQNFGMLSSVRETYLPLNENYIASQFMAQNRGPLSPLAHMPVQQPGISLHTNGQWENLAEARSGSNIAMTDIFRNDRFGVQSLYSTNQENSICGPNFNNLYSRAFGM